MTASSQLPTVAFVNAAIAHLREDEINWKDFGIEIRMALGGGIVIGDVVKIAIDIQALKYSTGNGKPSGER